MSAKLSSSFPNHCTEAYSVGFGHIVSTEKYKRLGIDIITHQHDWLWTNWLVKIEIIWFKKYNAHNVSLIAHTTIILYLSRLHKTQYTLYGIRKKLFPINWSHILLVTLYTESTSYRLQSPTNQRHILSWSCTLIILKSLQPIKLIYCFSPCSLYLLRH